MKQQQQAYSPWGDLPTANDTPKDAYGKGYVEFQARQAFEDLCRVYGFASARMIQAEIINDYASGRNRR